MSSNQISREAISGVWAGRSGIIGFFFYVLLMRKVALKGGGGVAVDGRGAVGMISVVDSFIVIECTA